jgi:WhiB family transcriptional regulator, redox-sensing transcriptional regulator
VGDSVGMMGTEFPTVNTDGSQGGICITARRVTTTSVHSSVRGATAVAGTEWVSNARCRGIDPDELFVRGSAQRRATLICQHCPVIFECAAEALDNRVEFGVWGGMTERQRRSLLQQHPEVVSWSEFFTAGRNHRSAC